MNTGIIGLIYETGGKSMLLTAENLSKNYGMKQLLDNV